MIEREFKVMNALYNSRVPVPKMYYLCEDPEEIGTPYYVMEFVEGKAYLDPSLPGFSAEARASLYDQMNLGLANLHSVKPKSIGLEKGNEELNIEIRCEGHTDKLPVLL